MTSKSYCPICNKEIKLVPKPGDPTRVQGFCNHGDVRILAQPVIEMNADQKAPVKQPKKGKEGKA
jgi:hypothetical protein